MKKKEIEEEEKRNTPWKGTAQSEKNSKDVARNRVGTVARVNRKEETQSND